MKKIRKRSTKSHLFIFDNTELWSTDSEDDDYIQEKSVRRKAQKRLKLIEDYNKNGKCTVKGDCISTQKSISKVCKLWHRVSLIPLLWTAVDFSSVTPKVEKTVTEFFHCKMLNLSSVNLSGWTNLKLNSWRLMSENCPNLQSIDLTGTKVNGECLLLIASECLLLKSITLSNIKTNAISQGVLTQLFEVMNVRLKSFCLSNCFISGISKLFGVLLVRCPNMESFELSGIGSKVTLSIRAEELQRSWKSLKILRLTNGCFNCIAEPFGPGFSELQELSLCNLENHSRIKSDFISSLVFMSKKLRLLDLRLTSCFQLPIVCPLPIISVTYLYLNKTHGCYRTIGSMLEKWKNTLIEVDLSDLGCSHDDFKALMEFVISQSFPSIKSLSLRNTPTTPRHILGLIRACPNLKELDLSQCRSLPRGTKRLYNQSSFSDLISCLKEM